VEARSARQEKRGWLATVGQSTGTNVNNRDPYALDALFDQDAEFVNVTGLQWHTRVEIHRAHACGLTRIFKDSPRQTTDLEMKRLSGEIAVVDARMMLTGQTSVAGITPRSRWA